MSKRKNFLALLSLITLTTLGASTLAACSSADETPGQNENTDNNDTEKEPGDTEKDPNEGDKEPGEGDKNPGEGDKDPDQGTDNPNKPDVEVVEYQITVTEAAGLTAAVDKTKAEEGATVTVTLSNVAAHKNVTGVKFNEEAATKVNDTTYTFKMPKKDVTVTIVVEDVKFTIAAETADEAVGTVAIKKADAVVTSATFEEVLKPVVTITNDEYVLDKLMIKVGEAEEALTLDENGEFKMPAANATVKAYFKLNMRSVTFAGDNLAEVEIESVTQVKEGIEDLTAVPTDNVYGVINGRGLKVAVKDPNAIAHYKIVKAVIGDKEYAYDAETSSFTFPAFTSDATINFVIEPVAKHSVTLTNSSSLSMHYELNGKKRADLPESLYPGEKLVVYVSKANGPDVLDLHNSVVKYSDDSKTFDLAIRDPKSSFYSTEVIEVTKPLTINISSENLYLDKVYTLTQPSSIANEGITNEYTLELELISDQKVHAIIKEATYGNVYKEGTLDYEVDEQGIISFAFSKNTPLIKFELKNGVINIIEGNIFEIQVNYSGKAMNISKLNETLKCSDTTKPDFVLSKDGTAKLDKVTGPYEIKYSIEGTSLVFNEKEYVIDLTTKTYEPVVEATELWFTNQKFTGSYNNSNYDWGIFDSGNGSVEFSSLNNGQIAKFVLTQNNSKATIENVPYRLEGTYVFFKIEGTEYKAILNENTTSIRFVENIPYNGTTYYLKSYNSMDMKTK